MGFTLKMGIVGIWLSMTLDLIVRFGLTWWRYRRIPWVREIGQVNMPANS